MGATTSRTKLFTDYDGFVDKFRPRKTTDDCYTPEAVYEAVSAWARETYGIPMGAPILRPFRPGGDYEAEAYPEGCHVIDNPPFSILSEIVRFYVARGIHFFLFAPALTVLATSKHCNAVACGADVVYANGAQVRTSFVTDLGPKVRTAPDLRQLIERAQKRPERTRLPTYELPPQVLTSARLATLADLGVDLRLRPEACAIISNLDAMRRVGKGLFGGGVLFGTDVGERVRAVREDAKRADNSSLAQGGIAITLSSAEAEASRRLDEVGGAYVGWVGGGDR